MTSLTGVNVIQYYQSESSHMIETLSINSCLLFFVSYSVFCFLKTSY